MQPRDYQQDAITETIESLETHGSALMVLPTGTGKTVIAGHIIGEYWRSGRIMFLAHRDFLLTQASDKIRKITGIGCGVEMADLRCDETSWYKSPVVVSTIQTQISGRMNNKRYQKFDPDEFSLVVIDEAHRSAANSYRTVVDYYKRRNPNIRIMGMTATPDRHDRKALGSVFGSVGYQMELVDAISQGWLVDIKAQAKHLEEIDLSDCATRGGDFVESELNDRMLRASYAIADHVRETWTGKKTLLFAPGVKAAEIITDRLIAGGISAALVIGRTDKDERRTLIDKFRSNGLGCLVNVGVATEGFDVPEIHNIIMARPTKSRALYAQCAGRGTRPLDGLVDPLPSADARREAILASEKPELNIIDFVGNTGRHKLTTPCDILSGKYPPAIADLASKKLREGKTVTEAVSEAKVEYEARREAERKEREAVKLKTKYRTVKVDPFRTLRLVPMAHPMGLPKKPATEKQVAVLEKYGIDNPRQYTSRQASQLIDRLFNRRLPTIKQIALLSKYGLEAKTRDEAGELITRLRNNGWRPI